MKYCYRCERTRSRDSFGPNRLRPDGLQPYCKSCRVVLQSSRAVMLREKYRRYVKLPMQIAGCAWCGYRWNVEALHLDHLVPNDPDKFGGHTGMYDWVQASNPLPREIRAEMSKCQVLCCNCHAERTVQQRQTGELSMGPARTAATTVTMSSTDPQLRWLLETPTTTGPHDWQPVDPPATTTGGQP